MTAEVTGTFIASGWSSKMHSIASVTRPALVDVPIVHSWESGFQTGIYRAACGLEIHGFPQDGIDGLDAGFCKSCLRLVDDETRVRIGRLIMRAS